MSDLPDQKSAACYNNETRLASTFFRGLFGHARFAMNAAGFNSSLFDVLCQAALVAKGGF